MEEGVAHPGGQNGGQGQRGEIGQGCEAAPGGGQGSAPAQPVRRQPQRHLQGKGAEIVEQQIQSRRTGEGTEEQQGAAEIHPQVGQTVQRQQGP